MEANGEELPTIDELKRLESNQPLKCLDNNLRYKTYLAWRIVKQMEANGEELPTMMELETLPSNDPLKCLANTSAYAKKLKSQQKAIERGDDGTFYNLQCTGCGNKKYGILTAHLNCTHCNRIGCGYQSEYWKMADGSNTPLQCQETQS